MFLSLRMAILFLYLLSLTFSYEINNRKFPKDFMLGVGSSSYQIEGAWNENGKGESIWDRFVHTNPRFIVARANADVACDSYHKLNEDVGLLKELGVDHYKFSISWPRILPEGFANKISKEGVNYYKKLLQELRSNNIEPLVVMYDGDLPQILQDLGGWTNNQIVTWFADYVRVCFELFGESVTYWITFNDPKQICQFGYGAGFFAPGVHSPGIGEYLCSHNIIKSHAVAWRLYNKQFREEQNGRVGFSINAQWYEPISNSADDQKAAHDMLESTFGLYMHPLIHGDYPEIVKTKVARRSEFQGFPRSRLPEFTETEVNFTTGTVDFIGLNYYNMFYAAAEKNPNTAGRSSMDDIEIFPKPCENSEWIGWGIRKLLVWIKHHYENPNIIVTENGYPDSGTLYDNKRVEYIQLFLSNVKDAREHYGVNVTGYTVRSFMDNFEWTEGYGAKYGIYHVNFLSPHRTRAPKNSAIYYQRVIKTRCLVNECKFY